MKNLYFLLLTLSICLFSACQNSTTESENSNLQGTKEDSVSTAKNSDPSTSPGESTTETQKTLFAWVDNLRIRNAPSTNSEVIATVKVNTVLTFTGEQSDTKETITLRNVQYTEPWLKVKTNDGKVGWVFGGAVKEKGENKGTDTDPSLLIDIPNFGRYDLSEWVKTENKPEEGGDYEGVEKTFTKGNQKLILSSGEMGEYGYSRDYKLLDQNKLLKLRTLQWSNDPFTLTETVFDLENNPGLKHSRKQQFTKHFSQLSPRPETVKGSFVTETLTEKENAEIRKSYK